MSRSKDYTGRGFGVTGVEHASLLQGHILMEDGCGERTDCIDDAIVSAI
jgi:hypothetical protein